MTKQIPIGNRTRKGLYALVDDEDYILVAQYRWHLTGRGYAVAKIGQGRRVVNVSMHRLIMSPAGDMQVDHKNGDVLDNRRENLRVCTQSQNQGNRRRNSNRSSQYKGVSLHRPTGKWLVHIKIGPKVQHLGLFADEIAAAERYDQAAREHFGAFACVNFPREGERSAA